MKQSYNIDHADLKPTVQPRSGTCDPPALSFIGRYHHGQLSCILNLANVCVYQICSIVNELHSESCCISVFVFSVLLGVYYLKTFSFEPDILLKSVHSREFLPLTYEKLITLSRRLNKELQGNLVQKLITKNAFVCMQISTFLKK